MANGVAMTGKRITENQLQGSAAEDVLKLEL